MSLGFHRPLEALSAKWRFCGIAPRAAVVRDSVAPALGLKRGFGPAFAGIGLPIMRLVGPTPEALGQVTGAPKCKRESAGGRANDNT